MDLVGVGGFFGIRAVLPDLEGLVGGGLVTLEKVEVVVYRADPSKGA